MPAWTGCDVCELPQFRVHLTVYVPERFDLAGEDAPLPPGEYVLVPAESHDPTKEMHSPYRRGTPRSAADATKQRAHRAVGVAFLLHGRRISPADDGPRCTARDCMCFVCCVFPDHHLSNSARRTRRRLGVLHRWNKQNAPPGVQRRWGVSYRSRNRWRRSHSTEYALPRRPLHLLQPLTLDHCCARRRMRTPRRRAA